MYAKIYHFVKYSVSTRVALLTIQTDHMVGRLMCVRLRRTPVVSQRTDVLLSTRARDTQMIAGHVNMIMLSVVSDNRWTFLKA